MEISVLTPVEPRSTEFRSGGEADSSGVAWGAVIGGAFVAAAFYFILLALGAGFGLSAVSPWSHSGAESSTMGTAAIAWLIAMEIIASALGGYITGRLRTKWALIHNDEVFFRDTANGLLAWAVALVVSVTLLGSTASMMVGRVTQAVASQAETPGPNGYFVDTLFRTDHVGAQLKDPSMEAEASRILVNATLGEQPSVDDENYLAQVVASKTGLTLPEAQKRVQDVVGNVRQAEDTARKATAHFLLWFFISLIAGALSASYFATIGGRLRDHLKAV